MLDPSKPLSGQLAHLQPDPVPPADEPRSRSIPGPVPIPGQGRPGQADAFAAPLAGHRMPVGRGEIDDMTGYVEPVYPAHPHEPRRERGGHRRPPSTGAELADQLAGRLRSVGRDASTPGNRTRVIVAVVLVLIVVAGVAVLLKGVHGGSGPSAGPTGSPTTPAATAATPLIPVQEYSDRGMAVNVPKDWTKSATSSYVDFIEAGGARKIRINVEATTATPQKFLTTAETGLKKPTTCPSPYTRVALIDNELANQTAAQLEYTCGTGDAKRHGIWEAAVVDGKAYHFYLTVPDSRFDESRIIFQEMLRSFHFVS
jgi:eukaryotic-like serine/threonine-protein kinase